MRILIAFYIFEVDFSIFSTQHLKEILKMNIEHANDYAHGGPRWDFARSGIRSFACGIWDWLRKLLNDKNLVCDSIQTKHNYSLPPKG